MENRENIKRKIRQLLLLSEDSGATVSEAQTALNKAMELMKHYMLSFSSIQDAKEVFQCVCKEDKWRNGCSAILRTMETAIATVFDCEHIYIKSTRTNKFFGNEVDVSTTLAMVEMCHSILKNNLDRIVKKNRDYFMVMSLRTFKNNFYKGYAYAIMQTCAKLLKDKENTNMGSTGTALVVMKDAVRKDEFARIFPEVITNKAKPIDITDKKGFTIGHDIGKDVTFNKAIDAGVDK